MMKILQKIENVSKTVMAIITSGIAILGVLLGIYRGIYKLNVTASDIVKTIPTVANHSSFIDISIDYDIMLAEKQLLNEGEIDEVLMRKLLSFKEDMKISKTQMANIRYLESKTKY